MSTSEAFISKFKEVFNDCVLMKTLVIVDDVLHEWTPDSVNPNGTTSSGHKRISRTYKRISGNWFAFLNALQATDEALAVVSAIDDEAEIHPFAMRYVSALINEEQEAIRDLESKLRVSCEKLDYTTSETLLLSGLIVNTPCTDLHLNGRSVNIRPANIHDIKAFYRKWPLSDHMPSLPTATVTANFFRGTHRDAQNLVSQALKAIQLYTGSRIRSVLQWSESERLDMIFGLGGRPNPIYDHHVIEIAQAESQEFEHYVGYFLNISKFNFSAEDKRTSYLARGESLYLESTEPGGREEDKVAKAMAGLEALLTTQEGELNFKLQKRAAILMRYSGLDSHLVNDFLKLAYDIRSKIAHGDVIKPSKRSEIDTQYGSMVRFATLASDILRLTLLILSDVSSTKEQIIAMVDRAMIDPRADALNRQTLANGIHLASLARRPTELQIDRSAIRQHGKYELLTMI